MAVSVADYFFSIFHKKMRKIPVNAGLSCPNRDGTIGTRGCIYCNNAAFNPSYALQSHGGLTEQLDNGIRFQGKKLEGAGILAYFQSYTNTYGETDRLIELYEEALSHPLVEGLVIATRPDCLKEDLLDWFEGRFGATAPEGHPFLLVELGMESTEDATLERIGRGHDWQCCVRAVDELHRRGIAVGAHLILGLPGEDEADFMKHAERISALPVSTLKLHQLQVIKGTPLAEMYSRDPSCVRLFSAEEYASLVNRFVAGLRPDIALDRVVSESPASMLLAPCWGLKPSEFSKLLTF